MCISCIRRTIFLVISTLVSFIVLRKGSNLILFAFLASSVLYLYASRRIWGSGFCLVCLLVKFAKAFFCLPKWFCQIRKGIFLPSEMVLSNSQRHFSALRNGSVKFAKAFFRSPKWFCQIRKGIFRPPKWFCQIRKGIFPPSEMVLSNSQRHFSALRNGSVKFAKAFFRLPKCLCQFRNRIFPMCK